eukprot:6181271-Pleurochrysis_carterae.AAC.2
MSKWDIRATKYYDIKMMSDNPQNGPLTDMHSDIPYWRYIWDIPNDPIGCIRSAAMFYLVPVATIMETMFYMGLRAISECRSWRP